MSEEQSFRPTRRSPEEIAQLLEDYEKSGLTRIAFCQARGISKNTLDLYRKRQRQSQEKAGNGDRLVPVELSAAPPSASNARELTVVLPGGRRIEVKRGFDAGVLAQLVELLERA